jgi:hypothetical protein
MEGFQHHGQRPALAEEGLEGVVFGQRAGRDGRPGGREARDGDDGSLADGEDVDRRQNGE